MSSFETTKFSKSFEKEIKEVALQLFKEGSSESTLSSGMLITINKPLRWSLMTVLGEKIDDQLRGLVVYVGSNGS